MKNGLGLGTLVILAAGCAGGSSVKESAKRPQAGQRCGVKKAEANPKPLRRPGEPSSALALARKGTRTFAYVANADDNTLRTIDIDKKEELAKTSLPGTPAHVLVLSDGRVAVTLKDKSRLLLLQPDKKFKLTKLCSTETAAEPFALTTSNEEKSLLVTSGWGRALSQFSTADLKQEHSTALPREPRAVVVSNDGKTAFVSHVVGGKLSAIDLQGGSLGTPKNVSISPKDFDDRSRKLFARFRGAEPTKSRQIACQGYALAKSSAGGSRVWAPQVLVDPGDPEVKSFGYGDGMGAAEVPSVAVIDAVKRRADKQSVRAVREHHHRERPPCLLPRAAAFHHDKKRLLVACLGIDSVVEYDTTKASPRDAERRRFAVASGPLGLALDEKSNRAVVWSQFDQTVGIIDLNLAPILKEGELEKPSVTHLALSRSASQAQLGNLELGRKLFFATSNHQISSDGRACASCHPDGREDSLTWATPMGPRQTPMLAGRLAKTAPFGWDGKGRSVAAHLDHTFQRLGGMGLSRHEKSALIAYVASLPSPLPLSSSSRTLVARGKKIFHSARAACGTCHAGGTGSDRQLHDVKSAKAIDTQKRFDTPSLKFIAGTAPYFHDGRYRSLDELVQGVDGTMGHTAHLSKEDRRALIAYLETL